MAVKIRLKRTGAKNDVSFRVVVADTRSPRDGSFIEQVGWYDPKKKSNEFELKMDRIEYWKNNGAQLSETVASLIKKAKKSLASE